MEFVIFSLVPAHALAFPLSVNSSHLAWNLGVLFIVMASHPSNSLRGSSLWLASLLFILSILFAGFFLSFKPLVCFLHIIVVACGWKCCLHTFLLEQSESCHICLFWTFSSSFYWQKSPGSLARHSRPSVISLHTPSAARFLVHLNPFSTTPPPPTQLPSNITDTFLLECHFSSHSVCNFSLHSSFCIHLLVHVFCSHWLTSIFVPDPGLRIRSMETMQTAVLPPFMVFQGGSQIISQEIRVYKWDDYVGKKCASDVIRDREGRLFSLMWSEKDFPRRWYSSEGLQDEMETPIHRAGKESFWQVGQHVQKHWGRVPISLKWTERFWSFFCWSFHFSFSFMCPTMFIPSPEVTLVFLRNTCLFCLIVNLLNEFPLNSLRTMTVHCTFPFFLLISSRGRDVHLMGLTDYLVSCLLMFKYNLADGSHLANSGTYVTHFVPWLFYPAPWTS